MAKRLFSKARWIWDGSDARGYNYTMEARQRFKLAAGQLAKTLAQGATLRITADAFYQVRLNGVVVGSGPAKSAEGRRSVDEHDVVLLLREGENQLLVTAQSFGEGAVTYCPGDAGLIFELALPGRTIASGPDTDVRIEPTRNRQTVRRWFLPPLEDIDTASTGGRWRKATVVQRDIALYPRRVPLPSRDPIPVRRLVSMQAVRLVNNQIAQRVRKYLPDDRQKDRSNVFDTPYVLVTDIVSPIAQTLMFRPALGSIVWVKGGTEVAFGSCWSLPDPGAWGPTIRLKKGRNRLYGLHRGLGHLATVNLAAVTKRLVRFENPFGNGAFQIVLTDEIPAASEVDSLDWDALRTRMPRMDAFDSMVDSNPQDRVVGAEVLRALPVRQSAAMPMTIPGARAGEAVRTVLDLGELRNGRVRLDLEGAAGDEVILSLCEWVEERDTPRVQWPSASNNAMRIRLREGRNEFESMHAYGGRFVLLHHTSAKPMTVHRLELVDANCGSRSLGTFRTADVMLNDIHAICARTNVAGVDDTFTDCPLFEQVDWNFDNRNAFLADALIAGNWAVARNTIELFAEDTRTRGLVRSQYPGTWENWIPLWSFYWIRFVWDYYLHTADSAFARRMLPTIRRGLREALGKINQAGLLEWKARDGDLPMTVWHFVEWGHGRDDEHAVCTAEQAGLVMALQAGAGLAEAVGKSPADARAWRKAADSLAAAVNRHLWDPRRKAYADSLHEDGTLSPVSSQVTNAFVSTVGIASPARSTALLKRIHEADKGLIPFGSPYGLYYVLEHYEKHGQVGPILDAIHGRWGEMVLAGDTTCWETFAEFGVQDGLFPTRSRCHPCNAFVVKYLIRHVLGLEMLEPGYARFRVKPTALDLPWAEGAVPTPHGLLRVRWERKGRRIALDVEHPEGTSLVKG